MRYSKSPVVKGPPGPLSLIKRSASPGAVKHILSYPDRGPRAGGASASSRTSFSPAQKQAAWAYRTTSRSTYMGPISLVGWRHGQCKPYVHQVVWRCQSPFRIPARVDLVWYAGPVSHSFPWSFVWSSGAMCEPLRSERQVGIGLYIISVALCCRRCLSIGCISLGWPASLE